MPEGTLLGVSGSEQRVGKIQGGIKDTGTQKKARDERHACGSIGAKRSNYAQNTNPLTPSVCSQSEQTYRGAPITITWVGHATFLIQLGDVNVLTDPVWGDVTFLFKRQELPRIAFQNLPKIHYVLFSHNHRDHMDDSTIMRIKKAYPEVSFLVPLGDKNWFVRRGITRVQEFSWWQVCDGDHVRFTFLPARHWSGRGLFDRNRSLWGSWMIEGAGKTIYFAGDTAYWRHFACVRHYFSKIDVAIMPIAPREPEKHMQHVHLNVQTALRAFEDLGAHIFVPMHYATFEFGLESVDEPLQELQGEWQKRAQKLSGCELVLPAHMQARVFEPRH